MNTAQPVTKPDPKDDGVFVTCERCGERILCDDAWPGYNGYLCDCCHDDLWG